MYVYGKWLDVVDQTNQARPELDDNVMWCYAMLHIHIWINDTTCIIIQVVRIYPSLHLSPHDNACYVSNIMLLSVILNIGFHWQNHYIRFEPHGSSEQNLFSFQHCSQAQLSSSMTGMTVHTTHSITVVRGDLALVPVQCSHLSHVHHHYTRPVTSVRLQQ